MGRHLIRGSCFVPFSSSSPSSVHRLRLLLWSMRSALRGDTSAPLWPRSGTSSTRPTAVRAVRNFKGRSLGLFPNKEVTSRTAATSVGRDVRAHPVTLALTIGASILWLAMVSRSGSFRDQAAHAGSQHCCVRRSRPRPSGSPGAVRLLSAGILRPAKFPRTRASMHGRGRLSCPGSFWPRPPQGFSRMVRDPHGA
jgi:hypothetical protein